MRSPDRTEWIVAGLVALAIHVALFLVVLKLRPSPATVPDLPDARDSTVVGGMGVGTDTDMREAVSTIHCEYTIERGGVVQLLSKASAGAASPGSGRVGCPSALTLALPIDSAMVLVTVDQKGTNTGARVTRVEPDALRDQLRSLALRWELTKPRPGRIVLARLEYEIVLRR